MIYGLQDDARLFFTLASAADEGMLTYELAQVTIGFCFNFSKKKRHSELIGASLLKIRLGRS